MPRLVLLLLLSLLCCPLPSVNAAPTSIQGQPAIEQQELQRAKDFIDTNRADEALMVLRGFVVRYPESPLVATANFWLAKIFYQRRQFADASILNGFPPRHGLTSTC